jgi:hypothetical protein
MLLLPPSFTLALFDRSTCCHVRLALVWCVLAAPFRMLNRDECQSHCITSVAAVRKGVQQNKLGTTAVVRGGGKVPILQDNVARWTCKLVVPIVWCALRQYRYMHMYL